MNNKENINTKPKRKPLSDEQKAKHAAYMREKRKNDPDFPRKNREYKKEYCNRPANAQKCRELNTIDVRNHRARLKSTNVATSILTSAIKTRKAKAELNKLKEQKQQDAKHYAKQILNDIIDKIPKESLKKKQREYMRNYRNKVSGAVWI